jgi:hypothetical protein
VVVVLLLLLLALPSVPGLAPYQVHVQSAGGSTHEPMHSTQTQCAQRPGHGPPWWGNTFYTHINPNSVGQTRYPAWAKTPHTAFQTSSHHASSLSQVLARKHHCMAQMHTCEPCMLAP